MNSKKSARQKNKEKVKRIKKTVGRIKLPPNKVIADKKKKLNKNNCRKKQ